MAPKRRQSKKSQSMNSTANPPAEPCNSRKGFSNWPTYQKALVGVTLLGAICAAIALSLTLPVQQEEQTSQVPVVAKVFSPVVQAQFLHDKTAFTQGLAFTANGDFLESTGLYDGRSSIRRVDLQTGKVLYKETIADTLFAEGIAVANGKVFMLTWKSGQGFVYDASTLERIKEFTFATGTGEGWGITFDGEHLVVSDGSNMLYYWDVDTLSEVRRIAVKERNANGKDVPVSRLNELEYVNGEVWANVWYQNRIVRIEPKSGRVIGILDCTHLLNGLNPDADVFNGLALMPQDPNAANADGHVQVAVTGKFWDRLYVLNISNAELEL